jgi:hypothetical protein
MSNIDKHYMKEVLVIDSFWLFFHLFWKETDYSNEIIFLLFIFLYEIIWNVVFNVCSDGKLNLTSAVIFLSKENMNKRELKTK